MFQKIKKQFIDFSHKYTAEKGFSRFEFYRSSIYSITTSLVILFISKFDSLDFSSWLILIISLVFVLFSVNNFTSLALILKNLTDQYYRDKIDENEKISVSVFLERQTKNLYNIKIPKNLLLGICSIIIALGIVFYSSYTNKNINNHKSNIKESLIEIKASNILLTDSLNSLKKEVSNLTFTVNSSNKKIDSILKKCK